MSIFDRRVAFRPYDYPEVLDFKRAINHSYWLVTEWNFLGDIHDFNVRLTQPQRSVIKNALLAISQIEVSVKRFWTRLGDRFGRSEFEQVGVTCGESEVRHADAYSHLLSLLGLDGEFARLLENPAIQGRVDYLSQTLAGANRISDEDYTLTLALFSIFIENVSLFSQFLVIKSFNKYLNVLKDIDNVVQATQKEELIHALLGVYLIKQIRAEFPHYFGAAFMTRLHTACQKAFEAECQIVDWIFEAGELEFLSSDIVKEFIKHRFNESLQLLGYDGVFTTDSALLAPVQWFHDEIHAEVNSDFFHKKPVTYSKKLQAITAEDLF